MRAPDPAFLGACFVLPTLNFFDVKRAIVDDLGAYLVAHYEGGETREVGPSETRFFGSRGAFRFFSSIDALRHFARTRPTTEPSLALVTDSLSAAERFSVRVYPYTTLDPHVLAHLHSLYVRTRIPREPTPQESLSDWVGTLGEKTIFQRVYPLFYRQPNKEHRALTQDMVNDALTARSASASRAIIARLPEHIAVIMREPAVEELRKCCLRALSANSIDVAIDEFPHVAATDVRYIVRKRMKRGQQ